MRDRTEIVICPRCNIALVYEGEGISECWNSLVIYYFCIGCDKTVSKWIPLVNVYDKEGRI